jgi:hypothetical protein
VLDQAIRFSQQEIIASRAAARHPVTAPAPTTMSQVDCHLKNIFTEFCYILSLKDSGDSVTWCLWLMVWVPQYFRKWLCFFCQVTYPWFETSST